MDGRGSCGILLKLLGKDPYDERAHQDLTRTLAGVGRYGEARRARMRYEAAMREIGVTPVVDAHSASGCRATVDGGPVGGRRRPAD